MASIVVKNLSFSYDYEDIFKDVAIVQLEKNIEKYVVTVGLNYKTKSWINGYYCKSLKVAGKIFNNLLEDFYMVSFKI